ncbi:MAG: UDP-N-acetylglucosamine 1-carboxyvinyltransferase [Alphaproteobacteria bacterium]|nr:UDP-N-acetylglucosamine 1-carboxyvinyltransferase [Alphaproteobacteria bacterium]
MDRIRIRGGNRLVGTIPVSGAKNAALPIMAASLLTSEPVRLENVPRLADIESMLALIGELGATIRRAGSPGEPELEIGVPRVTATEAPYDIVRKMRASVLVLGPLVGRCGRARVSLPGGCAIGTRPIDLHLAGLRRMGANIDLSGGYVEAALPRGGRLHGARHVFPIPSVGATENLMMAAVLARGESELVNAAREPEIVDLADCLVAMGAQIEGAGTDVIHISGRETLGGATHRITADRIEAGTYAIAACITGGGLELTGIRPGLLERVFDTLSAAGARIDAAADRVRVTAPDGGLRAVDVVTEPYPGFPTDLQAQLMACMTIADGSSLITETIFENRFMHVSELVRMGADITVRDGSARVNGIHGLAGAPVMATDLRASVSLVLAGLAANGETTINRIYHLDRGYERLVGKLVACGAVIERETDADSVQVA